MSLVYQDTYRLDWLQYTFLPLDIDVDYSISNFQFFLDFALPANIVNSISLDDEWVLDCGLYGYKYSYIHKPSSLRVMFGYNTNTKSLDLGINVIFSGKTLRYFCKNESDDVSLACFVRDFSHPVWSCKPTRVDVCLDSTISFHTFLECIDNGNYRTPVQQYRGGEPTNAVTRFLNAEDEGTVYIGKKTGLKFIRIYDKIRERRDKLKGQDLFEYEDELKKFGFSHITRLELSCRNRGKKETWASVLLDMFIEGQAASVFYSHIKFGYYKGYDHNNKPAFVVYDWYEDLLNKSLILFNEACV